MTAESPTSAQAAFDKITDTFTGADGGLAFLRTKRLVDEMARRATEGDDSAAQLVQIVTRFARLIEVATTFPEPPPPI